MIHPFTRMVIYGVIWYQGESNSGRNTDKYSCTFSNLIRFWRQAWNERTNNITDIQLPFGFVQVMEIFSLTLVANLFIRLVGYTGKYNEQYILWLSMDTLASNI
jgi:hypothetical protein